MRHSPPRPLQRRLARAARLALAAAALTVAGCRRDPAPAPARPPLRVAIDLWAGYYPLVIAQARGDLAAEGVAVDLQVPGDTHRMIADFAAHRFDLIGVSLADIVLAMRVNPEIRMILCSDESSGADVIMGLAPFSAATNLHGRRVGTTLGGFGELFVREFLAQHHVRPDEVVWVNTDATSVPALLQRGEIDIGHTWEPYAAQARAAGAQVWFSSAETPGLIADGLMAHSATLRERAPEVRGLVRAWFRALDWWRQHPAEGNRLVEQRLHLAAGSVSWEGIRLLDRAANRRAFAAGPPPGELRVVCARYIEFFIARGALGERLSADRLLDARFLDE